MTICTPSTRNYQGWDEIIEGSALIVSDCLKSRWPPPNHIQPLTVRRTKSCQQSVTGATQWLTSGSNGTLKALNPDPEHKPSWPFSLPKLHGPPLQHINSQVKARVSLPANCLLKLTSSLTYDCFHKLSVLTSTRWLHVCVHQRLTLSLANKELLYLVTSNAIWKLVFHHNPDLWIAVERIDILYRITSRTKKCYIYPIM